MEDICRYNHHSWRPSHLNAVRVVVQQKHSQTGHLLGLHHCLHVSQIVHVFGHICGQHLKETTQINIHSSVHSTSIHTSSKLHTDTEAHHVDHHFTERVFLLLAQFLEDVTIFFLQQFEAHSQVMILQDRGIIVH